MRSVSVILAAAILILAAGVPGLAREGAPQTSEGCPGGTLLPVGKVPGEPIIAYGTLHWTRSSICQHPIHGGFLQYYMTDGCGRELFLSGDFQQFMVGHTIWAEGGLLHHNRCSICKPRGAESRY